MSSSIKMIFLFLSIFCNFFIQADSVCVGICSKDLIDKSLKGQEIKDSLKKEEGEAVEKLDKRRKEITFKESELLALKSEFDKRAGEFERKKIVGMDGDDIDIEESELNRLFSKFEDDFKSLAAMKNNLQKALNGLRADITKKYDQIFSDFDKDVSCRYAPLNNWDMVFDKNNSVVAYLAEPADQTEILIKALDKQVNAKKKTYTGIEEFKQLFDDLGIIYLEKNIVDPRVTGDLNGFYTSFWEKNLENVYDCSVKYAEDVENYRGALTTIKLVSDNVGFGLFAEEDIKDGDIIREYTGEIVPLRRDLKGSLLDSMYAWTYPQVGSYTGALSLDSNFKGNEIRFVNHGNHPNCLSVKTIDRDGMFHICYVAIEDIKKGEQILVSYGMNYWSAREFFEDL